MEPFTEEHSKRLLGKEWLAKSDAGSSTPYLLKYSFSMTDLSCTVMVTDTQKVWGEVVSSKLLARRWRASNPKSPQLFIDPSDEDNWRENTLELLSKAHTIGGITDASCERIESNYSDLCLRLEWEGFTWQWETCFLGYQQSSEIISKQLVFPLISVNHLTFSATDAIGGMSDTDVEKALDKLGRSARRAADTHIKNTLSKPRLASCINRMTALFNFLPDLPHVVSVSERPVLEVEETKADISVSPKSVRKDVRRTPTPEPPADTEMDKDAMDVEPIGVDSDSVTESDTDEPVNRAGPRSVPGDTPMSEVDVPAKSPAQSVARRSPAPLTNVEAKPSSDPGSPKRLVKKIKTAASDSSDDDNKNEPKRIGVGAPKRGTRQPIKRGGKRF